MFQKGNKKTKFFIISGIILIGISLICVYKHMVISNPEDKFEVGRRSFYLKGNKISVNFELAKDAYFLKLEHQFQKGQNRKILFNGLKFATNTCTFRKQKPKGVSWIHFPRETVRQGNNTIDISFVRNSPPRVDIYLSNFRTQRGNKIYLLFADSNQMPSGLTIPNLGYRVLITPDLFWRFALVILSIFLIIAVYTILNDSKDLLSKATNFLFAENKFDIRIGTCFGLSIIIVSLWAYLPSFHHPFIFDDLFIFFLSKHEIPNLQFVLNRIDLTLNLPGERLMFRPLAVLLVSLNRVIFDTNYVGPHVVTFILHIFATFSLWWLLWKCSRRWISALFALLFSVLAVSSFPVVWPQVNGYIITTIFTILAIITFHKTLYNEISVFKGFALTALLLFLNSISTEIAIFMPFVFFFSYWTIFRNRSMRALKQKDKGSWFMFLLPALMWGVFYSIHLYFVRFHLGMTAQANSVNLLQLFINVGRSISLLLTGIVFPIFISIFIRDKIYFKIFDLSIVILLGIVFALILAGRKRFIEKVKSIMFPILLICSIFMIICLGRPLGISRMLAEKAMAGHYVYAASALIIFAIYIFFNFDKITSNTKRVFLLSLISVLIVNHAFLTHQINVDIQKETAHLRAYYDSVRRFVLVHKNEPDFSFKIIDRPPKLEVFGQYHETCIDGLFNRFINNKNPKYFLEYDYDRRELEHYLYSKNYQQIVSSRSSRFISENADYVDSIGVSFKRISGERYDFLIGMFEITQKQWKDLMGFNPSVFKGNNRPVENVSYYMVQEFIKRLNKIEGRKLYRLPILQEYLYLINSGLDYMDMNQYAWSKDNAGGTTHSIGELHSLPAGFYDVIGNVWEWTREPIGLPLSIGHSGDVPRVCFGGSWWNKDLSIYNLNLDNLITNYPPDFQHEHLGFRLVREIREISK